MRTLKALILLLLTAGTSPLGPQECDRLAEKIEAKVELPAGAKPLSAYGRNYAFRNNGEVVGVYMLPFMVFDGHESCFDGAGKPCTKEARDRLKRYSDARRASQASPGTRRWFASERDLPLIMHGGCTRITVIYDIPTGLASARCNN